MSIRHLGIFILMFMIVSNYGFARIHIGCGSASHASDPCQSGKYYSKDPNGNLIELKCCSFQYGAPQANVPFVFGNHHFLPADTLFRLRIQCNGSGLFQDWYDFSSVVSQFNRPGIHWRSSGDSLYVDIFDSDAIEPYIKAGTLTTLAFHLDYFIPLCMGGTPYIAGLPEPDIIRLPKLGFKSFTNPVQDGVLKFVLVNNEVIPSLTAIQLMDISGKIVQEFHVHQLNVEHEEQKLELKGVASGNYFLKIRSKSDQVAVQVLVK